MNIKALLGVAAISAVALSAMAQSNVYSLNVVGYVNQPVPAGQYALIANQLNTTNNTIASLLPGGPPGAILQKFNGSYAAYTFDDADMVWVPDGNATLNPGEGCFFRSPVATTLTFVGEVLQGALSTTLPKGAYAIRSSLVPQAGKISTDLGLPGEGGDIIQTYAGSYSAYTFDDADMVWTPTEPTMNVGQAFFIRKSPLAVSTTWTRNFTVQ